MAWWREGILYQIYVRSFADSNGDGIGDLRGVLAHLDHVQRLGVDGIWLSPIHPSPNDDWGYDVSGYQKVHPELGTLADVDALVEAASSRGLHLVLDLVPNHTSDRHPWFIESRAARTSPRRGWYVWADGRHGGPPNNWISSFGGPAWTLDAATGQYYLHNFLPTQPDLDWWNEDVRAEFDRILSFWFDRGIAGFRIDVCHMLVKDRELRDNPPATEDDHPFVRFLGQRSLYNSDRAEVHDVLRRWRRLADRYDPPRLLLGETFLFDLTRVAAYAVRGDELDLAFNFPFVYAPFEAAALRDVVETTERSFGGSGRTVWTASNHDAGRFSTRWCGGDPRKIRCALLVVLALRGAAVLYYGDEIGMTEVEVPPEAARDPLARLANRPRGRDGGRTPMHWDRRGGFTTGSPWLPSGDSSRANVADQERDPGSVLHFCRRLISLRRSCADLRSGAYRTLPSPDGAWIWRRGEATTVAVNLSEGPVTAAVPDGRVLLDTGGAREGETVRGAVALGAFEGVVIGARCQSA